MVLEILKNLCVTEPDFFEKKKLLPRKRGNRPKKLTEKNLGQHGLVMGLTVKLTESSRMN